MTLHVEYWEESIREIYIVPIEDPMRRDTFQQRLTGDIINATPIGREFRLRRYRPSISIEFVILWLTIAFVAGIFVGLAIQ